MSGHFTPNYYDGQPAMIGLCQHVRAMMDEAIKAQATLKLTA